MNNDNITKGATLNDDQFFLLVFGLIAHKFLFSSLSVSYVWMYLWVREFICVFVRLLFSIDSFGIHWMHISFSLHLFVTSYMNIVPSQSAHVDCRISAALCIRAFNLQPNDDIAMGTNWQKKWLKDKGEHKSSQIIISQPFASYDLPRSAIFIHLLTLVWLADNNKKKEYLYIKRSST